MDNKISNSELLERFKLRLRAALYQGGIRYDLAHKVLNATDNSIYELQPLGVLQPKNANDLKIMVKVANEEIFKSLTFTPRGGGTGTNGQSLTHGIVVDTSRYMTSILDFSKIQQTVTVEPGVVLGELNRYLRPHGLMFAPNISTSNRATIGGMIATDAAGKGSLIYGKTSDHLESVSVLMMNGESFESKKLNPDVLEDVIDKNDHIGHLHQKIQELLIPVQDEIAKRFPRLKRPLSGYNLRQCYIDETLDLTRLIAGSEGTLAFITEAKLKLIPIPKYKRLVVVHYETFLLALADAAFLIEYQPIAVEAVDSKVQKSAETLPNWPELAKLLYPGNLAEKGSISNFIEFVADNHDELITKTEALISALNKRQSRFVVIDDIEQINQLWGIRSLAVGLVANIAGPRKPIAFVEDAIVPPENLYAFVKEFEELLNGLNLHYAMYGHVDVGCIHVRPALDMQKEEDRAQIRYITTEVLKLTDKYHGLLWGEHGKGFRGEFVKHVFGDKLYAVIAEIKTLFDPDNRLNPGKLVAPNGEMDKINKIDLVPMRGEFDSIINQELQQEYINSFLCNGNGACFNRDTTNVMCPSYKVTDNRIHSPKGRASLVKEWLRVIAENKNPDAEAEIAEVVFAAMSGCLGCKSCAGKCPTKVNIPDLRSKFLDNYHKNYRQRSLREFALGYIEHILLFAAYAPKLWNFMLAYKLTPKFALQDAPVFASNVSLRLELKRQNVALYKNVTQVQKTNKPIVIMADVFSGLLDRGVLFASIKLFFSLGYTPYVIYPRVSGKALLVGGFLDKFKQHASEWANVLDPLFIANIPVVGLENSITLIFRDEISKFYQPLKGRVQTLAEILAPQNFSQLVAKNNRVNKMPNTELGDKKPYALLSHCTEQALHPSEAQNWQTIFAGFGQDLHITPIGCCGMAGTYGHQEEHKTNSRKLFSMHWQPHLDNQTYYNLATGFSCRSQVKRFTNKRLPHPIEVIATLLAV